MEGNEKLKYCIKYDKGCMRNKHNTCLCTSVSLQVFVPYYPSLKV